jgi:Tol biopolymer transport system component
VTAAARESLWPAWISIYDASFSFDGEWVVFTSERHGSADIFRVRANGMGLERLTDSPAFDDQAALSPDGYSLAFVSTRDTGSTEDRRLRSTAADR